jgi:hypothetical protein
MADRPGEADAALYVYWCPKCERQFERLHHNLGGGGLIPQLDEYHTCKRIEVVPAARLSEAEQQIDALNYEAEQRGAILSHAERRLSDYEQALRACAIYIASDCEGSDFEPSALALARAALSGSAGPRESEAGAGDAASGVRAEDSDLSGDSE